MAEFKMIKRILPADKCTEYDIVVLNSMTKFFVVFPINFSLYVYIHLCQMQLVGS